MSSPLIRIGSGGGAPSSVQSGPLTRAFLLQVVLATSRTLPWSFGDDHFEEVLVTFVLSEQHFIPIDWTRIADLGHLNHPVPCSGSPCSIVGRPRNFGTD